MCEGRFSGRSVELILPIESVRAIYCRDSGQGLAFDDEDLLEGECDGELGADVTQASQPTNGPKQPGDKPKLRLV
jgi:stringent starvation protein B